MDKRLKPYQIESIETLIKNKCHALFADPGLGKTAICLYTIKYLLDNEMINNVLIVAPLIICRMTWPKEIRKWQKHLKQHIQRLYKAKEINPNKKIFLLNSESLHKWDLTKFDMLIIDESTKFKNPSTRRFKTIRKSIPSFQRRIILSGSPTPESSIDLFSQIFILDEGKALGDTITGFRNIYCKTEMKKANGKLFPKYVIKKGSDKAIAKKISHLVTRLDAKDHYSTEGYLINDIWVTLNKKDQAAYNSMEKNLFIELKGKEIMAYQAGSSYNKCRQLANGAIYKEDSKNYINFHNLKIDMLENLLDELQGKPVLIGYSFKHDLARIKKRIKDIVELSSNSSPAIIRNWNKGNIPYLAGQIGSISHGLNLQYGGSHIIFFSLTDSLEAYEQFIRRIYRMGFKGVLQVHRILCRNTVDEPVRKRLKRKAKSQDDFLKLLHSYMFKKHIKPS